jgi:hypothetical protein
MLLKKALTTMTLATVLLTSSISANELATQGISGSTAKVEAFKGIPSQNLSSSELNEKGEFVFTAATAAYLGAAFIVTAVGSYYVGRMHEGSIQQNQRNQRNNYDDFDY